MKTFNRIYINGRFVTPHGTETLTLVDPTTEEAASIVTLADVEDTRAAIAAAKTAYAEYRHSTLAERGAYLQRLHDALTARMDEHVEAIVAEYGGTRAFARAAAQRAADNFLRTKKTMKEFAFTRHIGRATVHMDSLGVVGIITPWNSSSWFSLASRDIPAMSAFGRSRTR